MVFRGTEFFSEKQERFLAEALSSGVPTVTTDAVGCGEVIEDDVTGLIAPAIGLAEAIEKLVNNPQL
jgi:glycosyltransferase involved in cell wall biosynthesis